MIYYDRIHALGQRVEHESPLYVVLWYRFGQVVATDDDISSFAWLQAAQPVFKE